MDALKTPHLAALQTSVARLYEVFGTGHVSAQLEVCLCPVCMTEATRQQIIATRNCDLPADLICSYSNSAHGVPVQLADLALLVPRYLALIAQDEMVDDIGVGTELLRLGDARAADPDWLAAPHIAALEDWGRAALWHFAHAEAMELDNLWGPVALFETLCAGGWDVDWLTGQMTQICADDVIGIPTLDRLVADMSRNLLDKKSGLGVNWFALSYVAQAGRQRLVDWLNGDRFADLVLARATSPDLPADIQGIYAQITTTLGRFHADAFPVATHRQAAASGPAN